MNARNELTLGLSQVLRELIAAGRIRPGQTVVIGASTSEVIGESRRRRATALQQASG